MTDLEIAVGLAAAADRLRVLQLCERLDRSRSYVTDGAVYAVRAMACQHAGVTVPPRRGR